MTEQEMIDAALDAQAARNEYGDFLVLYVHQLAMGIEPFLAEEETA